MRGKEGRRFLIFVSSIALTCALPVFAYAATVPQPVVTSPTNPDSTHWYANSAPVFQWELPSGVDAVSFLLDPKPLANPGNRSDGLVSSAHFSNVTDGITYFHIKFHRAGIWGPITHVPVRIDTVAPARFQVVRNDVSDLHDPQPQLTYSTTDITSGIATYEMNVDAGAWFGVPEAPASAAFTMPVLNSGEHTVTVRANDAAGNSTQAAIRISVLSYPWQIRTWHLILDMFRWHPLLAPLIWIGALALLTIILGRIVRRHMFTAPPRPLKAQDRTLRTKLQTLIDDMDDELGLLQRIGRDRPLYPEEQYLRSKLGRYQATLRTLVSATHKKLARKK